MNKYRELLLDNMNRQLGQWFDQTNPIPHDDVHRFLHSLKGTSGTLGMPELNRSAQALLDRIESSAPRSWPVDELRAFLLDLIRNGYVHVSEQEMLMDEAETGLEEKPDKPLALMLDDDVAFLMYVKEGLEKAGWSVIATTQAQKTIEYFHDVLPDCLILDLHVPDTSGFEVMRMLEQKRKKQYIPTTLISNDCLRETRLSAFRMGIDDMMCKPLDMEELVVRLERQLNNKRRLERLLFVDELTGAYNRKYMNELFAKLAADLKRTGEPFTLAMLDLDHFKQVNDSYGHLIGDQVLCGFTAFLKEHLRAGDCLIRYGGEEFVVLLPGTGLSEAKTMLARLIDRFSHVSFDCSSGAFACSFSAGAVLIDDAEQSMHKWLEAADHALYKAKVSGRKRVETAQESQDEAPSRRKINVAIVDDDAMIRTMLSEHVKECLQDQFDPEVRAFRDGEAFFEEANLSDSLPYLVILDGMMPRMDGLEVLQRIRKLANADRFTVIMLTGRKGEQDIVKALRLGADDYMIKPFSILELEARIKRLVKRVI